MNDRRVRGPGPGERGFSLLELMVALIVLSIGVLAVARLFPAGAYGQIQDRMQASAGCLAQDEIVRLGSLSWSDSQLATGRHPASGYTTCGTNGRWWRSYTVTALAAPLTDVKQVTVTVTWANANGRDVSISTYVRS